MKTRTKSTIIAGEPQPAVRRDPQIISSARAPAIPIDYRSVVKNALDGLSQNTAEARRAVYDRARLAVRHRLRLMRLPEPVIELEELALDLAIGKIERQRRAEEAAAESAAAPSNKPPIWRRTLGESLGGVAAAMAALGPAMTTLAVILGLRPAVSAAALLVLPLRAFWRGLFSPVGLAAALPVVVMAAFVVLFVDNNIAYRSFVDGPAGRWLAGLDLPSIWPAVSPTLPDQVAASPTAARPARPLAAERSPPIPGRQIATAAASAPPAVAKASTRGAADGAAPDGTPTRIRTLRVDLSGQPLVANATPQLRSPQLAAADVSPPPVLVNTPSRDAESKSPPDRGPTRIGTVHVDLSGTPGAGDASLQPRSGQHALPELAPAFDAATPAQPRITAGCNGAQILYIACGKETEPDPASASRDGVPAWLANYDEVNHVAPARVASPPPVNVPASADSVPAAAPPATTMGRAGAPSDALPAAGLLAALGTGRGVAPPAPQPANAKVAALFESGKRAAAKGDLDHAVQTFTELIRIDPKFPDSYSERGQALFKIGETERAIADYSTAIERNPRHGAALRARGMAYLYRGSTDLALADLTRAIDLAENDPALMAPIELFYARRSRATIYSARLQFDQEIGDCTGLIVSYERDPALVEALKSAYGEVGAANIVAAVHRQRATAYVRQSNFDLALADLGAAIPLSADHGYAALIDRAKLNEGLGQREQAIADLQNALALRPTSEEARLGLRRLGAAAAPVPGRAI